jgi:murein DD-endopeptidase MepM/ murein hydrolase activator NlpD
VLPVCLLLPFALALSACAGSGGSSTPTPARAKATATAPAPDLSVFRGFIFPLKDACLPSSDNLMPNAARSYRDGVHEGIDFYEVDNCTKIGLGTPVLAAKDGTVIRADHNYHDLTQAQLDALDARIAAGHAGDPDVLDMFRGRQVWVDHGHGIVTRYAHLSAIPDNIQVGTKVAQGETIAAVGDSGTPESVSDKTAEMHLHFELRAGDGFLGRGLPPEQVRALYANLFTSLGP